VRKEDDAMTQIKSNRFKYSYIAVIIVILGVVLDQWTKHLAVIWLKGQEPKVLVSGVLELLYLENKGAAFGMLQNQQIFFLIITAIILIAAIWLYCRIPVEKYFLALRLCIVMLISGAIGNLIDRIRLKYVVDFIYFKLIDFPVFNVADIFVTVSMFLLIILLLFFYKEEDFDQIFYRRI